MYVSALLWTYGVSDVHLLSEFTFFCSCRPCHHVELIKPCHITECSEPSPDEENETKMLRYSLKQPTRVRIGQVSKLPC